MIKACCFTHAKSKTKHLWSMTFNLGHEMRGNTIKPKMRTRMKNTEFVRCVRRMTDIVYKTIGRQCQTCNGSGRVTTVKKDGTLGKAKSICKVYRQGCGLHIYWRGGRVQDHTTNCKRYCICRFQDRQGYP